MRLLAKKMISLLLCSPGLLSAATPATPPVSTCNQHVACLDSALGKVYKVHPGKKEEHGIRAMTLKRNFVTFKSFPIAVSPGTCPADSNIVLQSGDLMSIVPDGSGEFIFTLSESSTVKLSIAMQAHLNPKSEYDFLSGTDPKHPGIEYAVYILDKDPTATIIGKFYFLEAYGEVNCTDDRPEKTGNVGPNSIVRPKAVHILQSSSGPGNEPPG